jgi:hypothetical protein
MRSAAVSSAAKFSLAISFALALSLFALARPVVAQDATKTDSATPAAKQSDSASDRQQRRAERSQAETAAKAGSGTKSADLAKFPKADATAAANAAPAKQKMECRKQEVTGSRMGKNVCATPEQWAQADEAAAEAIRQMRSEASSKAGQATPGGPFTSGGRP